MALIYISIFLLGLALGSFANVVISRIETEAKTIFFSRSRCPKCGHLLRWYDLLPLLSFIILSGKCRYCRKPISWQYPAVELTTALWLMVLWLISSGRWGDFVYLTIISLILIVIFVSDLQTMTVSLPLVQIGLLIGLIYYIWPPSVLQLHSGQAFSLKPSAAIYGLLISLAIPGALVLITKGRGMGEGDIGIGGLLGLTLAGSGSLVLIAYFWLLTFWLGGLVGSFLLLSHRKTLKSAVPFAPFMIIAWAICLVLNFF